MEYSEVRFVAEKDKERIILAVYTKYYFENFLIEPIWLMSTVELSLKGYKAVREYKVNGVWQEG